jgi:cytochrome c peroxidase
VIRLLALSASAVIAATLMLTQVAVASRLPNTLTTPDASGAIGTFSTGEQIILDTSNAFFASLGTNGRSCLSCHSPTEGWTLTPPGVKARFAATRGLDPLFRLVDGANTPNADVSSENTRRSAYSMLLSKALIRVGIGVPAGAEFTLYAVDDPYGFASSTELSLFRRPLPSTNLGFLSAVMWDGRETIQPITSTGTGPADTVALQANLTHQALDATFGHAQATSPPTPQQLQQIVAFELSLFTAQVRDRTAGSLSADRAGGDPERLARQRFDIGINDPLGPSGRFTPRAMRLFDGWSRGTPAQQAVARGETLFNTRPIAITGVAGLNDTLGQTVIQGTCTTCHNTPNAGNHSVSLPINIGVSDADRRTPDLPLYTLRNAVSGQLVQTTDPGRALITGKWADIGKFKGPVLRGLAARAPYFHNGSAAGLDDVVSFYDRRFHIGLGPAQRADLLAFLRSL